MLGAPYILQLLPITNLGEEDILLGQQILRQYDMV